jgi:signal transduction histidine kinase
MARAFLSAANNSELAVDASLRSTLTAFASSNQADYPDALLIRNSVKTISEIVVNHLDAVILHTERDLLHSITSLTSNSRHRKEFLTETAKVLCECLGAQGCSILVVDQHSNTLVLGGTTGLFDPRTGHTLSQVSYAYGEGCSGWIWKTRKVVRLFNAKDEKEWRQVDPTGTLTVGTESAEFPNCENARPFLGIPILNQASKGGRPTLGIIRLHAKSERSSFLVTDERLLLSAASLLAPLLIDWEARDSLRKAHDLKDGLFDIIEACSVTDDLSTILHTIASEGRRMLGCFSASILLREPQQDKLRLEVMVPSNPPKGVPGEFPFTHGLCGLAATQGVTLMVPDVASHPRYYRVFHQVKSEACTPILHQGRCLGILTLNSDLIGFFSPDDANKQRVLEVLAKQAGLAIHRDFARHERDAMHDRLIRTTEMLTVSTLASALAHELKNGLAAIGGILSNLQKELQVTSQCEALKKARLQSSRLGELAQKLLDLTRTSEFRPQLHYLNDVVDSAAQLLTDLVSLNKMKLLQTLDATLSRPAAGNGHMVDVDARHITQIMTNLILNAIDASARGQTIAITTAHEEEGQVSITVRDYGKGLAPDVKPRMFELFFTTKPKGFGVGLHIVQDLVRTNQGRIEIESKPGAGTAIKIMFPTATKGSHL